MVDVSAHGFRAAHNCPHLGTGEEVMFEHALGHGRARVVWNRIAEGQLESGFLVLQWGDAE
jgi:hypothetical protein